MKKSEVKESVVKVYETSNYDQFKTMSSNRSLDVSLIRNLKESVEKNDLLAYNPILVNEKMEVIDGQHRLEVCKDLNHPVFYIVKKGELPATSVRDLNVNKKNWNNEAYFNFYVQNDDEVYKEFATFYKESGLTLMSAVTLFSNGKTSTQQFRRGALEKDDKNWEIVMKALNSTRFANDNFNIYLIKALIRVINSRKRAFNEKKFHTLVERLEYSVGMHWNCEKRYVDLFEGRISIK